MGSVENCDVESGERDGEVVALDSIRLKVFIVGGGIGGLTAAIALRQQGHEVQVGMSMSNQMIY